MTPEPKALIARLRKMESRDGRHDYSIGDFWNAVGDAADALEALSEDADRLDWLDSVNAKTNAHYGTRYGWRFDKNHNRSALTDHNLPALSVRDAIDEARKVKQSCK